jgi:hypothetical protein
MKLIDTTFEYSRDKPIKDYFDSKKQGRERALLGQKQQQFISSFFTRPNIDQTGAESTDVGQSKGDTQGWGRVKYMLKKELDDLILNRVTELKSLNKSRDVKYTRNIKK